MRLHNICTCTIINRITGILNIKNNLIVLFTTQLIKFEAFVLINKYIFHDLSLSLSLIDIRSLMHTRTSYVLPCRSVIKVRTLIYYREKSLTCSINLFNCLSMCIRLPCKHLTFNQTFSVFDTSPLLTVF